MPLLLPDVFCDSNNISFSNNVSHDETYEAAHLAMIHRHGNCFVFYGLTSVLLDRAGIPNRRIERTAYTRNPNRHRWNLFNPDGLGWFHMDTTPSLAIPRNNRFMFTTERAAELTQHVRNVHGTVDFFTFDIKRHPELFEASGS